MGPADSHFGMECFWCIINTHNYNSVSAGHYLKHLSRQGSLAEVDKSKAHVSSKLSLNVPYTSWQGGANDCLISLYQNQSYHFILNSLSPA